MTKNLDDIDLRSEEIQDLLGRVPPWITRNGILLVAALLIVLVTGSWFFKYPDIILAPVVVTSENPPAFLQARVDGKLAMLKVHDKQPVVQGQILAMLESSVNYEDLVSLRKQLVSLEPFIISFSPDKAIQFENSYILGELQPRFADFYKKYNDYLLFVSRNYYKGKIISQEKQRHLTREELLMQTRKITMLEEDLQLSGKKFRRDSLLNKKGVLSLEEFEKTKREWLQKQQQYEETKAVLSASELSVEKADQLVADAENSAAMEQTGMQLALREAWDLLHGALDVWEIDYLLKAPVSGEVNFSKFWSVNQNIAKGEVVFMVIPQGKQQLMGKVQLKLDGSGKVKPGQHVNLKFSGYPYLEFGMVKGTVQRISPVPTNDYYPLEVALPNGLVSTYGKKFEFQQELKGTAEIVTEDRRLLTRIFHPIKAVFNEHFVQQ